VKTVIVGGGAHSTPALFDSEWSLEAPRFSFELVGRSPERLAAVARAIGLVSGRRGAPADCRWRPMGTLAAALAGADVVLVQFRIGGYVARVWDEVFPQRYALCGDEGLGPGGLAAAWRTWDDLRGVLAAVDRGNPRATVVLLTSPIGILTRCARAAFPALIIYGICELPWTTLGAVCSRAGVEPAASAYAYLAVNHIGWFSNVRVGDRQLVAADDVLPLKYVRLQDAPEEVLAEQRSSVPRGRQLSELAAEAFAVFERGESANVAAAIARRQTPWYAHAVAPFLRSLSGDETGVTYFLTAPNDGYCRYVDDADCIEMPFCVRDGRLERRICADWQRDDVAVKVGSLVAYERLAAVAVLERDTQKLKAAIGAHPWLRGAAVSDDLLSDIVAPVVPTATSRT
jgi:6-phospho-beta-glucosidase